MKIYQDESQNIEYKESWNDKYQEWVCGFANVQCSSIFVRVNDAHEEDGVKVTVWRQQKSSDVEDNVTSLSQVMSQVEHTDNEHYKASLSQVMSQVVSQVMSQVNVTDLRLLTEVFISLQQERNLSELMIEFGQTNRTRFKSSCLNILIRAGLASPTIPDKPKSRFQKYVLTEKGKELIESVSGTNFS